LADQNLTKSIKQNLMKSTYDIHFGKNCGADSLTLSSRCLIFFCPFVLRCNSTFYKKSRMTQDGKSSIVFIESEWDQQMNTISFRYMYQITHKIDFFIVRDEKSTRDLNQ